MIPFLYAVLIFLVLRFSVTVFNFVSNPKLGRYGRHYDDRVSILIPARNEAARIGLLLQSILDQDYTNYEVIILDDDSTDDTYAVCERFASADSRFRVVRGQPLPADWLGKNFACHQLAALATGTSLLFLDADDEVAPGLINNLLFRLKTYKLALVSLFTNQVMYTFGEYCTVPLMHFLLLNLLPLRLVRLSRNPAFAAASGQCMFFDAAVYLKENWHASVKGKVVEDIEIMKLVKTTGYQAEALLANGFVRCRMYDGFSAAAAGFSKNLLAGFGNNIFILLLYLALVIVGPVLMVVEFDIGLLILPAVLIAFSRMMIAYLSGQKVLYNLLLHPLQMCAFLFIAVLSIKKHLFKTSTWKGRTIRSI
ncbi:glycosyl transferase family 2 [Pedobacter yulinensis]|uniref:Glycosyl transferase family 2 n=1 Tax=Pedobacter yulinensis TaxID=2126353 RepID=A0A2T3HQ65_9SPHI|nr:glycosyltransferase [Pedobacter yulinensis]PST84588.1 glycosyl transferase family 2 [Pedobacter yulinensis]